MKLKSAKVVGVEEKSVQEIETKLVEEHQKEVENTEDSPKVEETPTDTPPAHQEDSPKVEYDDEGVLKYIGSKLGKEFSSYNDLVEVKVEEKPMDLPEEVNDYLKFKSETNRGLKDYVELHRDYDSVEDDEIIKRWYSDTTKGLDRGDIEFKFNKKFNVDELDDEDDVKLRTIEKKQEAERAREYYNSLKEKYSGRLESSSPAIPEEELEDFNAYKQYRAESSTKEQDDAKRSEYFVNKTNELFSKFEGFKFNLGDNEIVYKPNDLSNFTPEKTGFDSFIKEHIDENGYLKDPEKYHRAMAIARDADAYARYFFEQGVASQVKNLEKDGKNISMDIREAGGNTKKGDAPKARITNPDTGNKLRIRYK